MHRIPEKSRISLIGILLAGLLAWGSAFTGLLSAHTSGDEVPPGVGVNERPGTQVPLDLALTDQEGRRVRLANYLTGGPVILTLNYYSCPTLCPVIFRNLAATVNGIKGLSPARDYRIVTVSIDPDETPARARAKAAESWRLLPDIADPGQRWPFLLGGEREIGRLAGSVGVRYVRLEKGNFAHPAVMVVLTPTGRIARYLYGIEQSPTDLKLALLEAADGRIGGSALLNRVLLYCYHYDPAGRKYALVAVNVMKIAGGVVLLLLGVLLLALWRGEREGHGTAKPGGRG